VAVGYFKYDDKTNKSSCLVKVGSDVNTKPCVGPTEAHGKESLTEAKVRSRLFIHS